MRCPVCKEEALPDAYVCRVCGAAIPDSGVADVTQRLDPAHIVYCPTCQIPMMEGFLYNPYQSPNIWWVAGVNEPEFWNGKLNRDQRITFPVSMYRCSQCGYLAAYARDTQ